MRIRMYALFGILFLICLIIDALAFGALANEAGVGAAIAASAQAQAPIAHTYIFLGSSVVSALPWLQTVGQSIADAALGDAYTAIAATPEAAIDLLFSESRGPLRALFLLCYWGAPLLLVLAIAAWLLRTRPTHLIKSARR